MFTSFRVPTAQVYPQFMHLAVIWFGFQDEMVLLSVLSNICKETFFKNLLPFFLLIFLLVYSLEPYTVNTKELLSDEAIKKYLAKVSIVTDEQRLQLNNGGNVVQPEDRNAEGTWYYSETTKNFEKLPLMYKGKISFSEMPEDLYAMTDHVSISVDFYHSRQGVNR
jgi:hypothetical protein